MKGIGKYQRQILKVLIDGGEIREHIDLSTNKKSACLVDSDGNEVDDVNLNVIDRMNQRDFLTFPFLGQQGSNTIFYKLNEALRDEIIQHLRKERRRIDSHEINRLKSINSELWRLWEALAECGQLSIGPNFSKNYQRLKQEIK